MSITFSIAAYSSLILTNSHSYILYLKDKDDIASSHVNLCYSDANLYGDISNQSFDLSLVNTKKINPI